MSGRRSATGAAALAAALTLLAAPSTGGAAGPGTHAAAGGGAARHAVHLSHTRMVVEGSEVVCRVRLFADDAERALRAFTGDQSLAIGTPAADSAFARYFAARFALTADGARLIGRLTAAGGERDPGGYAMRWYVVELPAPRQPNRLALRNTLLFDTFPDQQNVVAVLRMPGERRSTLYFAAGDGKEYALPE
ncbi:MAG: DUF6702 family protein [Gemmatimonadaceae bacterium]